MAARLSEIAAVASAGVAASGTAAVIKTKQLATSAIFRRALTGGRTFLGNMEQAPACINVLDVGDDWIVRAVNVTPYDLPHLGERTTTMEELWQQFRSM